MRTPVTGNGILQPEPRRTCWHEVSESGSREMPMKLTKTTETWADPIPPQETMSTFGSQERSRKASCGGQYGYLVKLGDAFGAGGL